MAATTCGPTQLDALHAMLPAKPVRARARGAARSSHVSRALLRTANPMRCCKLLGPLRPVCACPAEVPGSVLSVLVAPCELQLVMLARRAGTQPGV